jgi:DNA-binding transcriptional MerR regulator
MIKEIFDINEVSAYAGFSSPWMVDYLCRSGIVTPSRLARPGRGKKRLFSYSDVIILRALNELLKKGISVNRLAKKLRAQRKNLRLIEYNNIPFRYLLTNGVEVFLKNEAGALEQFDNSGQYCFMFVVDLHSAQSSVNSLMANPPPINTMLSFRKHAGRAR